MSTRGSLQSSEIAGPLDAIDIAMDRGNLPACAGRLSESAIVELLRGG